MSDRKPESWWSSFDHVMPGTLKGAHRLQAEREAKFDNKYGRNRLHEQQPQHQGGAGGLGPEKDEKADGEDSVSVELAEGNTSRKGRNTTMLWNFSTTPHRNSRTSSNSTSSSRI